MIFRIDMLPAAQGDALWIEYGPDEQSLHRVLFDAGTKATADVVLARIADLDDADRNFELLVVSHIDADHIGGAIPLLADTRLGATFKDIWFNGRKHLFGSAQPMGSVQGDDLTDLIIARGGWNVGWDEEAVAVTPQPPHHPPLPERILDGGLKLTILSPYPEDLLALAVEWPEVVRKHGLTGERATAEPELAPLPPGVQALGRPEPVDASEIDVTVLANRPFDEDPARPNRTSIALLAELIDLDDPTVPHPERRVMLCADAHPSVLLRSVRRLVGPDGSLELAALKLPHHGSKANVCRELLEALDCDRHLISTDGTRTHHPDVEAIARAIAASASPELIFNARSRWNEMWDDPRLVDRGGYARRFPQAGGPGGIRVTIA